MNRSQLIKIGYVFLGLWLSGNLPGVRLAQVQ